MALDVVPFTEDHLDAAALLAARHRRDHRRTPALPGQFEAIDAARAEVQAIFAKERVVGACATRKGRLVGYLLGEPLAIDPQHPFSVFIRPRSGAIPLAGHAVVPGIAREAYRAMYAEVATQWLAMGLDAHHVWIPATDRAAMEAWFALGFGHENTTALRATAVELTQAPVSVSVRRAAKADDVILTEQAVAILRDLCLSPTCLPSMPSGAAGLGHMIEELFSKREIPQWLAMREGNVVGMQLFAPAGDRVDSICSPVQAIYLLGAYTAPPVRGQGVGKALLNHSLSWAREAGYAWCVLDYKPANPAGSHFWEGNGFMPLAYRLCRQLDERVLGADRKQG